MSGGNERAPQEIAYSGGFYYNEEASNKSARYVRSVLTSVRRVANTLEHYSSSAMRLRSGGDDLCICLSLHLRRELCGFLAHL
jgi:hypothetical protein